MTEAHTYMLVHLDVDFVGELHHPGTVHAGCRVIEVRRSSVVFGQALFDGERVVATLRAVTVNVDRALRKASAFPEDARARFMDMLGA